MGCCDTMLRYIVFLINFVFFLASVALIAIGAYINFHMRKYLDFLDSQYLNTSIVLIILGAIILIVAFFGCCGACTENACMMYTYGTLMALILISLIGVAITIVVFKVREIKDYNNFTYLTNNCILVDFRMKWEHWSKRKWEMEWKITTHLNLVELPKPGTSFNTNPNAVELKDIWIGKIQPSLKDQMYLIHVVFKTPQDVEKEPSQIQTRSIKKVVSPNSKKLFSVTSLGPLASVSPSLFSFWLESALPVAKPEPWKNVWAMLKKIWTYDLTCLPTSVQNYKFRYFFMLKDISD